VGGWLLNLKKLIKLSFAGIRETIKKIFIWLYRIAFSLILSAIYRLNNLLVKRTYILPLVFIITYYFLFYKFPISQIQLSISTENEEFLITLFKHFFVNQVNDKVVSGIISSGTKLLSVIFSVILTLFIFSHREQRAIAPSATYRAYKNFIFLLFLSSLIITMAYGFHLSLIYKANINIHVSELDTTLNNFGRFITWVILTMLSFVLIGYTIISLFRTINIYWLLPDTVKQIGNSLTSLMILSDNKIFRKVRENEYSKLNFNVESVYQMLEYAAKNNMSKDFYDNIENLERALNILKKEFKLYNLSSRYPYLFERDSEGFRRFYLSILKNTLSLVVSLYKNNKFNKGQKALDLLFSLYSNEIPSILRDDYIVSLHELIQITDLKNGAKVRAILNGLEAMEREDTLVLYQALMLRIITENNIQLLTSVVYSMKKNLDRHRVNKNLRFRFLNEFLNRKYKMLNIGILLQCTIKSIELSHYGCTGFLIKFLVTNFSGKLLKEAFNVLMNNGKVFETIYTNMEKAKKEQDETVLVIDYYFNEETYDYCLKKLAILLYGQQKYATKNGLSFIEDFQNGPYVYIDIQSALQKCDYKEYILTKVFAAGDKYGLLYLKDKDFLRELVVDFNVQTLLISDLLPLQQTNS
jgi:hypothetical protein